MTTRHAYSISFEKAPLNDEKYEENNKFTDIFNESKNLNNI